jgi:hypothetical protein
MVLNGLLKPSNNVKKPLFATMFSIMNYQKKYFLTGDERLRPMI